MLEKNENINRSRDESKRKCDWNNLKDLRLEVLHSRYLKQFYVIKSAVICWVSRLRIDAFVNIISFVELKRTEFHFLFWCFEVFSSTFRFLCWQKWIRNSYQDLFSLSRKTIAAVENDNKMIDCKNFSDERCDIFYFNNLSCRRSYSTSTRMNRRKYLRFYDLWILSSR